MQKTAQKRSILNRLREKLDIPGAAVEGFFKPELTRIMEDLKVADDNIRTLLTSQKIGKADVDVPGGKSVKDLLKSARSNFNRREYMAGVADLGQFHKRLYDVSKMIDGLGLSVDRIHHNFLFQDLSPEHQENIKSLREHMSKESNLKNSQYFIKEAGFDVMDFFHNIGTKRGRALAIWEKKYPKVVKELREQGSRLIDQAESVLANTLSNLKTMATARATRKVDDYMNYAKQISADYKKFDNGDRGFRAYYNNVVKPALEQQDRIEGFKPTETSGTPAVAVPDARELGKQEVGAPRSDTEVLRDSLMRLKELYKKHGVHNPTYQMFLDKWQDRFGPIAPYASWLYNDQNLPFPTIPGAPLGNAMQQPSMQAPAMLPTPPRMPVIEQSDTLPDIPPLMNVPPASNDPAKMSTEEMRQFESKHGFGGSEAHNNFLESLETLSKEDPIIVAGYISKYARSIRNSNLEKAIELFTIAKRLRG